MKILSTVVLCLLLTGCITAQEARQVVADSLDAACNNLSGIDINARKILVNKNANATAMRAEADAVTSIQSACDNRPIDSKSKLFTTAMQALTGIAAIELGN